MEQDLKALARQLIIGAFVLGLVTAGSFGIRHIRFSIHRARTAESPVVTRTERNNSPAETRLIAVRREPQPVVVAQSSKGAPSADQPEAATDLGKSVKVVSNAKSRKDDNAKSKAKDKGSKGGLEKIDLGDSDSLYITQEGRLVYVGKAADGQTVKMEVQVDEATGEMTVVSKADNSNSKGSKKTQKISMGGSDNLYITDDGQTWYVTEGSKARVGIDNASGKITVLEQYGGGR